MKQLVLIRHGESAWNLENRFTGWADVDLTVMNLMLRTPLFCDAPFERFGTFKTPWILCGFL